MPDNPLLKALHIPGFSPPARSTGIQAASNSLKAKKK
jgi:hypothetical protein